MEDNVTGGIDEQPGGPNDCVRNTASSYEPGATCHFIVADQWVTVRQDLTWFADPDGAGPLRNCETEAVSAPYNGHVKLWIADEGQPFELVVDHDTYFGCSEVAEPKIGKIPLTPYNTAKNPAEVHPTGYVWYDNLWVGKVTP